MNEYRINILPFSIIANVVDLSFSLVEREDFGRVYKTNLPGNFPEDIKASIEKFAWWSIDPDLGEVKLSVNLLNNEKFAKYYLNKILYLHFLDKEVLVDRNFINDTVIYVKDTNSNQSDFNKFKRYSLRFDNNHLVKGTSLLVSFDGETSIFKKNLEDLEFDVSLVNRVLYAGRIARYKYLTETERNDISNINPVLNYKIQKDLSIPFRREYTENKYKKYFELINMFYDEFLRDIKIGNTIQILGSGLFKIHDSEIFQTSEDSNLLLFGNNNKNFIPYVGIKEYGPLEVPKADKPIKFIFIFHENDKDYANKLYSYLKKGYKSFPGLKSFVNLDFEIDHEKTIRFSNHDPIQEISDAIKDFRFNSDETYAAIYISQIRKDTDDEDDDSVYYRLKELLLGYKIISQVIFKDNINNPAFNYFLPNIAIALLAKLGGVPWRLYRPIQKDLVVGIGAGWSRKKQNRYIGSAFCFRNDGSFYGFNVFDKNNTKALADSIQNAIELYVTENGDFDRLVIHYYKKMSKKEE